MSRYAVTTVIAVSLVFMTPVLALDIGLEGSVQVIASDNIAGANVGDEEEGQTGGLSLGVYGEQQGEVLQVGFSGDIDTRRVLSDDEAEPSTVNNFFGAANLSLSRSLSWYFGDVLGGVRQGSGFIPIDDNESVRRNVFVTGPALNYDVDASNNVSARLLYIHQSETDRDLAQLLTSNLTWRKSTLGANAFGVDLDNIFTKQPEDQDLAEGEEAVSDNNRLSASVFWDRTRGLWSWFGAAGATRYDVDEDTVINGANGEFRLSRRLSPNSEATFTLGTDLTDETINTVNSLLDDGTGVEVDTMGVFQNSTASLAYSLGSRTLSIDTGVRMNFAQYKFLAQNNDSFDPSLEDNTTASVFGALTQRLTGRITTELDLEYQSQSFDNRPDESDSVVARAAIAYQINPSFAARLALSTARNEGTSTRIAQDGGGVTLTDTIENRVVMQLTWAPPSRASKEPVAALKQLLR